MAGNTRPRCIYTGIDFNLNDADTSPSHEHIIPLSIGGSNQLTTNDVCQKANNEAGAKIDDQVAKQLPILMLRHKYKLVGNRRIVPDVILKGEFLEKPAPATLNIDESGKLIFRFQNEKQTNGNINVISTDIDRARFLLKARLNQAKSRDLHLFTPHGEIKDLEDVEVALSYAESTELREFKSRITIDMNELHNSLARLTVKIALGVGHRVLGPNWTFGPGGNFLRRNLFSGQPSSLNARIFRTLPPEITQLLGLGGERHVMAVIQKGKSTVAIVSLFGGTYGHAFVDLYFDSRRKFKDVERGKTDFDFLFAIDLDREGNRPLISRSVTETAEIGMLFGNL